MSYVIRHGVRAPDSLHMLVPSCHITAHCRNRHHPHKINTRATVLEVQAANAPDVPH